MTALVGRVGRGHRSRSALSGFVLLVVVGLLLAAKRGADGATSSGGPSFVVQQKKLVVGKVRSRVRHHPAALLLKRK